MSVTLDRLLTTMSLSSSELAAIERPPTDSKVFAHTRWDALPVAAALMHCVYFFGMFYLFPRVPLWVMLILGFIYSISISWNINSVSHNFIHNPYFRSPLLNRLFSILESITVGFGQVFYECIHMQHHKGNADRPDERGETTDWISIYKHGHDGEAEAAMKYTFLSFFREDPKTVLKELKRKDPREAFWGIFELASFVTTFVILGILNWRYIGFLLPFWYLGHCLSYLNGYYRHYGGNPDEPIAWGVSTYGKLYNWSWFYNGYHAEHHFRPKVHWTRMQALRDQISDRQRAAGVRVINVPHALGFLEADLSSDNRQREQNRLEFEPASRVLDRIAALANNEFVHCPNTNPIVTRRKL